MSQLFISWSGLRTQEECRQKAHLLRTGHKNPAQDIRGYFHGTVVDRVAREWLCGDPYAPENKHVMPSMVVEILDREEKLARETGDDVVRWKSAVDKAEVIEFCTELVTRLEPILEDLVLPYEYEVAKRFRVPVTIPYLDGTPTTVILAGEMDYLTRDQDGNFSIWDLKGTKDNNYWRKTIAQNTFYDIAVSGMFGVNSKSAGLIQPMCRERVLTIPVTDQARHELMQRIIRMASDMWRKDYDPREDNRYCGYCPVRASCPKFKPVNGRMSLGSMKQLSDIATIDADSLLPD